MQSDDPDFETQGRGRDRPVRQSARPRGGVRRRREDGDSGARPPRSGAAAVARARRAPRLRVLPARHALAVRRAQHAVRRSARPDRAAAHQCRLRRLPRRHRRQPAEAARDSRHRRQPLDPQDPSRAHLSARRIRTCICTSRRPTRPGSTKSNSGLRRSSATCSRAASSRPSPTSRARFVATSVTTTKRRNRSAGPIAIRRIELVVLQRVRSTRPSAARNRVSESGMRTASGTDTGTVVDPGFWLLTPVVSIGYLIPRIGHGTGFPPAAWTISDKTSDTRSAASSSRRPSRWSRS